MYTNEKKKHLGGQEFQDKMQNLNPHLSGLSLELIFMSVSQFFPFQALKGDPSL